VAGGLLAFTIFFYVGIYTIGLKRWTAQNIVIGGAAGALPPVVAWAAATGSLSMEPVLLFLIIFFWTPPHFWALAMKFRKDYAAANVPMLPVVASPAAVARKILWYSYAMVAATLALAPYAGWIYGVFAAALGVWFLVEAHQLNARVAGAPAAREVPDAIGPDPQAREASGAEGPAPTPMRLFHLSIAYLTLLFAAVAVTALLPWGRW
jgi:protoheme IX farnesyltransferase